jgi:hypothetical protein
MIRAVVAFAVVGVVGLAAGPASAGEFPAMSACRANYQSSNTSISDVGITNHDTTNAVEVFCPLKQVICSATTCTYTANAWGADNDSTNTASTNVSCSLNFALRQAAGTHFPGTAVTLGTVGSLAAMALSSVSIPNGSDGLLYVRCTIGKQTAAANSYVTWIGQTNF